MRRLAPFVIALGLVMTAVGVIGAVTGGGSDDTAASTRVGRSETTPTQPATPPATPPGNTAPPSTTARATPAVTTPPTTIPAETPEAFFALLGRAFAGGDSTFLITRLHPLVDARYGADQCRSYLTGLSVPRYAVEVLEVRAPEPWDWTLDGRTDRLPSAIPVRIRSTEDGAVFREVEAHVVVVDGQMRWFTDCGTPL